MTSDIRTQTFRPSDLYGCGGGWLQFAQACQGLPKPAKSCQGCQVLPRPARLPGLGQARHAAVSTTPIAPSTKTEYIGQVPGWNGSPPSPLPHGIPPSPGPGPGGLRPRRRPVQISSAKSGQPAQLQKRAPLDPRPCAALWDRARRSLRLYPLHVCHTIYAILYITRSSFVRPLIFFSSLAIWSLVSFAATLRSTYL